MGYKAIEIADYIIQYCNKSSVEQSVDSIYINNIKLQCVLYFVQAEFLVAKGYPCFDDDIFACRFGVVIPNVYKEYERYGSLCIFKANKSYEIEISNKDKALINEIIEITKGYNCAYLSKVVTHQEPYVKNYNRYIENIIPNKDIKKYFSV